MRNTALLLVCAVLVAGCFRTAAPPPSPTTQPAPDTKPAGAAKQTTAEESDPFKAKVLAALKKCVDDPDGLEVVDWGELKRVGAADEFLLRFRAKTPEGGKRLHEWTCQIHEGKVVLFWETDRFGNTRTIEVPK